MELRLEDMASSQKPSVALPWLTEAPTLWMCADFVVAATL